MSIEEHDDKAARGSSSCMRARGETQKRLLEMNSPPNHRTMYSHVRLMNARTLSRLLKRVHESTFDFWGLALHKA